MGYFNKGEYSSLRFCQNATELPIQQLWELPSLTIAISKLSRFWSAADGGNGSATAMGIVHQFHSDGQPLLPAEIVFHFDELSSDTKLGHGSISGNSGPANQTFLSAHLIIRDSAAVIFSALERAFDKSVMSGDSFLHLHLNRLRRQGEATQTLDEGMRSLEKRSQQISKLAANREQLPYIEFDSVAFESGAVTNAPTWSWSWDNIRSSDRNYFDRACADWRRSASKAKNVLD